MAITIAAVAFIPRGAGGARKGRKPGPSSSRPGRPALAGLTQAAAAFNGALVPGQPLPAFGTCKHYMHSYRCAAPRPASGPGPSGRLRPAQ
jgi:hypothetical protein